MQTVAQSLYLRSLFLDKAVADHETSQDGAYDWMTHHYQLLLLLIFIYLFLFRWRF